MSFKTVVRFIQYKLYLFSQTLLLSLLSMSFERVTHVVLKTPSIALKNRGIHDRIAIMRHLGKLPLPIDKTPVHPRISFVCFFFYKLNNSSSPVSVLAQ